MIHEIGCNGLNYSSLASFLRILVKQKGDWREKEPLSSPEPLGLSLPLEPEHENQLKKELASFSGPMTRAPTSLSEKETTVTQVTSK